MNNRILIDTGPLVSLFDAGDNNHKKAINFLKKCEYRFISTLAVYTEVSYFLSINQKAQQDFFDWVIHRGIIIADINQHDISRITELMKKYSDLPMDFADASLLVTAEKTGIMEIVSSDNDFDIYRLNGKKKLNNVYYSDLMRRRRTKGSGGAEKN